MFGNAPRALWQKWCPPDDRGRIALACRAMLVDEGERKILFETGIGAFFEPKLRDRFGVVQEGHVLLESLSQLGLSHEDIDVVVLSHLHFDHAGGLLSAYRDDAPLELLFPKATYLAPRANYERAKAPHSRDRASFIPELMSLLDGSGRLSLIDDVRHEVLGPRYSFDFTDGHTKGMAHVTVRGECGSAFFAGDLIPGVPWVHVPITMGYDRFPELLIDEKTEVLKRCADDGTRVFFTHDAEVASCKIGYEGGRFRADEPLTDAAGWVSLD